MKVETLAFQELLKNTPDVFEAVVVLGTRASQIDNRRAAERLAYEDDLTEEELELFEPEEDPDYVEEDKSVVLAMDDYLSKRLTWRYTEKNAGGEEDKEGDGL